MKIFIHICNFIMILSWCYIPSFIVILAICKGEIDPKYVVYLWFCIVYLIWFYFYF